MRVYLADANIFLRFLLEDDLVMARKSKSYFLSAKKGQIRIKVISEIIPEMEYVLRKVYLRTRKTISSCLLNLVRTSYFEIEQRELWIQTLSQYSKINVDLVDIFLFLKAEKEKASVLSFDRDFKKLQRMKD